MTGSLQIQKSKSSGKNYYYVRLSYKAQGIWRQKNCSTGIESRPGNKRKAEAMIREYIDRYAYLEGADTACSGMSREVGICEYLERWIALKAVEVEATTTLATYRYRIRIIREYFDADNPRVAGITTRILEDFIRYLQASGKRNQKNGERGPMSRTTVLDYKHILVNIFSQAVRDGIIQSNPAREIHVGRRDGCRTDQGSANEVFFLEEGEIKGFLQMVKDECPIILGVTYVALYLGLRRSEVIGLKWDAVDFENHAVTICHTVTRVGRLAARNRTKSQKSIRTLQLIPKVQNLLIKTRETQKKNRDFYGSAYSESGYVFTWEDGHMINPDYVSRKLRAMARKHGRPVVGMRTLRHTCATLLFAKDWDMKEVQYWLGHEDIQTTMNIYVHFERATLNRDVKQLEDFAVDIEELDDEGALL